MLTSSDSHTSDSHTPDPQVIDLEDGLLHYFPTAFAVEEADCLLDFCLQQLPWRQDTLFMFGRRVAIPRLHCWLGDPGATYSWSGLTLEPLPWPAALLPMKQRVEMLSAHRFNAMLANHYRDGNDSVGWHSDDERELGPAPVIASVSLGTTRKFQLQHKRSRRVFNLPLQHGSLLVMAGDTQRHWRHQLPKEKAVRGARVNLTLRQVLITPA